MDPCLLLLFNTFLFLLPVKANVPVITAQQNKHTTELQCEFRSATPHVEINWHYGNGEKIVHEVRQSVTMPPEGLFIAKNHLSVDLASVRKVCCSVTGAALSRVLVTCTDVQKDVESLETDGYSQMILPLWCIIAIVIIGLLTAIVSVTIVRLIPKLCWKKKEIQIFKIDLPESTLSSDDLTALLIH